MENQIEVRVSKWLSEMGKLVGFYARLERSFREASKEAQEKFCSHFLVCKDIVDFCLVIEDHR